MPRIQWTQQQSKSAELEIGDSSVKFTEEDGLASIFIKTSHGTVRVEETFDGDAEEIILNIRFGSSTYPIRLTSHFWDIYHRDNNLKIEKVK